MQPRLFFSREQILVTLVTALFALFVIMLPRYTDTAKTWFALLILGATAYLALMLARISAVESSQSPVDPS